MATKYSFVAILLLIALATIFATCKKRLGCNETVYNFEIKVKAHPDRDSIHIGDTIWLEVSVPTTFEDMISGKTIDYSGAENFGTAISFGEMKGGNINDPGSIPAANFFDILTIIGKPVQNPQTNQIKEFLFQELSNMYEFKVEIIPKTKGIFFFAPSDAANVYRTNDKCTKASFLLSFANTNQHLYYYQNNRPGYTISDYEQQHMYCFKVY